MPQLPQALEDLRRHCLSFCGSLHAHHSREDGVFPRLAQDFPELKPALERLRAEHEVVAKLNHQITQLVTTLGDPEQLDQVQAELGRLSDELEAHFAYEESHLGPALDAA